MGAIISFPQKERNADIKVKTLRKVYPHCRTIHNLMTTQVENFSDGGTNKINCILTVLFKYWRHHLNSRSYH